LSVLVLLIVLLLLIMRYGSCSRQFQSWFTYWYCYLECRIHVAVRHFVNLFVKFRVMVLNYHAHVCPMFASLQCMACCIPLLQVTGQFWMCREISICWKTKRFIEHFCCQLSTSFLAYYIVWCPLLIGQRSPLLFAILAFFCSLTFNVCILLSVLWCCWLHDRKDPVCKNCASEQPKIG